MKTITQDQIDMVMKTMFALDIPVKTYNAMQNLFESLPTIDESPADTKQAQARPGKGK